MHKAVLIMGEPNILIEFSELRQLQHIYEMHKVVSSNYRQGNILTSLRKGNNIIWLSEPKEQYMQ